MSGDDALYPPLQYAPGWLLLVVAILAGIVLAGLLLAASLAALYPAFLVSRTSPADTSRPA